MKPEQVYADMQMEKLKRDGQIQLDERRTFMTRRVAVRYSGEILRKHGLGAAMKVLWVAMNRPYVMVTKPKVD